MNVSVFERQSRNDVTVEVCGGVGKKKGMQDFHKISSGKVGNEARFDGLR